MTVTKSSISDATRIQLFSKYLQNLQMNILNEKEKYNIQYFNNKDNQNSAKIDSRNRENIHTITAQFVYNINASIKYCMRHLL